MQVDKTLNRTCINYKSALPSHRRYERKRQCSRCILWHSKRIGGTLTTVDWMSLESSFCSHNQRQNDSVKFGVAACFDQKHKQGVAIWKLVNVFGKKRSKALSVIKKLVFCDEL